MSKIRTAILGMGRMGKIRYDSLIKHGSFEIVGLCDTSLDNMNGYNEPKYESWQECIDQAAPAAVFVCTYNAFISDIVCYALEHGIHVFAEKPPGRNLSDTLRMKDALEKNNENKNLVLKFGFNHRFHNSVMEAKALIDSGLIGDIVCARGVYGKAGNPTFATDWRNDLEISGGGILLDQGIHMIDLLYYFMGEFTSVQSAIHHLVWKEMKTEDSAFAIMETAKGQVASLHSSAVQWKHKFNLDIICTNGYVTLDGFITSTKSYGEETLSYYRKDLGGRTGKLGKPLEHVLCFDVDESWDFELMDFYNALVCEKKLEQGTVEQATYVMGLIEKIYANVYK